MSILDKALDTIREKVGQVDMDTCGDTNIGKSERVLSVISGGFILGVGVKNLFRSPLTAFSGIALGGALIYRGVTGHCKVMDIIEPDGEPEATVIEHRYFVK